MLNRFTLLLCLIFLSISCQDEKAKKGSSTAVPRSSVSQNEDNGKIFRLIPSSYSGIDFKNAVIESTEKCLNLNDYNHNGGGVAIIDVNNDGLQDLFFTGNDVSNRLYLNKGNFTFEDITRSSGMETSRWSTGATVVDINNDGWLDLYVSNSSPDFDIESQANQLFINLANNTFVEKAEQYGIDCKAKSTQASFLDYDKDGDLDLFVMNHSWIFGADSESEFQEKILKLSPAEFKLQCNTLYRNQGNGTFTDVSQQAGILKPSFGTGIITADLNNDGTTDIYVANDYFIPDFMFINGGNGIFQDKANTRLGHQSLHSKGADASDINNDGLLDFAVLEHYGKDANLKRYASSSEDSIRFLTQTKNVGSIPQYAENIIQLNIGRGIFSEVGKTINANHEGSGFANLFADFDNDGWTDYFISNGKKRNQQFSVLKKELFKKSTSMDSVAIEKQWSELLDSSQSKPRANACFKNNGGFDFTDVAKNWGLNHRSYSSGAAYADLDNDGDLDLVVNNIDQEAFIYENRSDQNNNNFIRVVLKDSKHLQRNINAKLKVFVASQIYTNELYISRGFQSAVEPVLHFGLGKYKEVDKILIEWNDGQQSIIKKPKINRTLYIDVNKIRFDTDEENKSSPLFVDLSVFQRQARFLHKENDFDDFNFQPLLPHKQSTLGPFISTADVNSDSFTDFFVGGAKGQNGMLYFQKPNGQFEGVVIVDFDLDTESEDLGSTFFDADNDGDLDLYICSGGGADIANDKLFQDRLYINNGFGNFFKSNDALPKIDQSTSSVKAVDFDGDGDMDLMVCGRTVPKLYPQSPKSYLLENRNGKFRDISHIVFPDLNKLGMITDQEWFDFDEDGDLDVAMVGEWMPLTFFKNHKGKFHRHQHVGTNKSEGWWQNIEIADLDNDGDYDIVAGNVGTNNIFHFSKKNPLYLLAHDFDGDATKDLILHKKSRITGIDPILGMEYLSQELPNIAEKIKDQSNLEGAIELVAFEGRSCVFLNRNSDFVKMPLPQEAQFFPINAIAIHDFDKDGIEDLFVAGNNYNTSELIPNYDAGKGLYLKGLGDGTFQSFLKMTDSGLFIPEEIRDIKLIRVSEDQNAALLLGINNGRMRIFAYRP